MIQNLNLMTRLELTDSQKYVDGEAFQSLNELLHSKPEVAGIEPEMDQFLVDFTADVIEDISFALEGVTWDMAQQYAQKVEEGINTPIDDAQFQHWQQLHEKWGYLEMTAD